MPGQVQAFIDRHWTTVLERISSWRANRQDRRGDVRDFVRTIAKEWETIPLEEKQIPYVPLERNFWAALWALDSCATGREVHSVDGELPENYEAMLAEHLETAYNCMRDRKPLPESGFVGRRHLP
jgi:hypothetical protein